MRTSSANPLTHATHCVGQKCTQRSTARKDVAVSTSRKCLGAGCPIHLRHERAGACTTAHILALVCMHYCSLGHSRVHATFTGCVLHSRACDGMRDDTSSKNGLPCEENAKVTLGLRNHQLAERKLRGYGILSNKHRLCQRAAPVARLLQHRAQQRRPSPGRPRQASAACSNWPCQTYEAPAPR